MSFTKGFKDFGHNITLIINSVLLTVVYVLGVGITSLIARVAGKKFLDTQKKDSYWEDWDLEKSPEEEYYRQF